MSKVYIGFDIGFKGGIVTMADGDIVDKTIMPLMGGDLDIIAIAKILNKHKDFKRHLVTEKFAGFFGYSKKAAVSVATQSGKLRAICALLKLPMTAITPQTWQKEMWTGTTIQYKKVSGKRAKDTKKTSILTATRLFPSECFKPSARYVNPHDGLVDAALLAEYGRRKGF